jgi:cytidyltransferase-like protein
MKRVMVFGTFDGVHDGHRHLLREAAVHGDTLVAVVARDEHVLELKGQVPQRSLDERMELISFEAEVAEVIPANEDLADFSVILEQKPSTLVFGFDQDELMEEVSAWLEDQSLHITTIQASAYVPEIYSASFSDDRIQTEEEDISEYA